MELKIELMDHGIQEYITPVSPFNCFVIPKNSVSSKALELVRGKNFIYFLVDTNEARNSVRKFYVGETTCLLNRLNDHKDKKKWWNQAIVFSGDSHKITEVTIKALESIGIEKFSKLTNKYELGNAQASKSEPTLDNFEQFNHITTILDFLGYTSDIDQTVETKVISKKVIEASNALEEEINKAITSLGNITCNQLKLYKNYSLGSKTLCAIWPRKKGCFEAELYAPREAFGEAHPKVKDIRNRLRGYRESAFDVDSKKDVEELIELLKIVAKR